MNTEFEKKYTIIKSIIEHLDNQNFSVNDILVSSSLIGNKYGIVIDFNDVFSAISSLYDGFEINRIVSNDGAVLFSKSQMFGTYEEKVSSR